MATLKVGLLGAGGIALQHAIGWQANAPRGELVAIADVTQSRAQYLSDHYTGGKAKVYAGIEELLADPNVEAVDICLPHHLHTDAIIDSARAGKAILCEKPLCTSLEDAKKIGDVLDETGVIFVMGHNQLFQPSLIEARRLLKSGVLGQPYYLRSIECFQHRGFTLPTTGHLTVGESPFAWRADPARMGGGEVLDTGWHASYRLLALANDRPVEVTAMTERFFVPNLPSEAFNPIEGWHFEIAAQYGAMAGGKTKLAHQLPAWPEPAVMSNDVVHTFTAEITHFLDVVQSGVENLAPFSQAARVLQLTKAAYRAVEEKTVIALPENPVEPGLPAKA